MDDEREFTQVTTRLESPLAEQMQAIATKERRSMSAQLVVIIEKYLAEQNAPSLEV